MQLKSPRDKALDKLKKLYSERESVVFLDTETTALDGRVLEICIIDIHGKPILNELINPECIEIDPMAYEVHKISLDMVQDKQPLVHYSEILDEIFCTKKVMIYNKDFDLRILKNSGYNKNVHASCLMRAYALYKDVPHYKTGVKNWKLTEACKNEGINIDDLTAHRAFADCELSRRLFLRLGENL